MVRPALIFGLIAALAGCEYLPERLRPAPRSDPAAAAASDATRPVARPAGTPLSPVPLAGAQDPAALDRVSAEQKAAAMAPASGGAALGTTVASLGDPAQPGLWIETPLVRAEQAGRVVDPASGKSVAVTLIPIDGPATAGSRLSLSAFQALGLPLAGLPTVEVFAG